jgi:hypothetical protein
VTKKRIKTTGRLKIGGKGKPKKVTPADEVTVRFQVTPGADDRLAITAPYEMPWHVEPIPGTKLSAKGTIAKDAPIEVKLPLDMFHGGRTANLVLEWGKDAANDPLTVTYMLDWAAINADAIGMRLVSLGYATGFLKAAPDPQVFVDMGTTGGKLPVLTQPVGPIEQQAVLAFEADQDAQLRGVFDEDTVKKLISATEGPL